MGAGGGRPRCGPHRRPASAPAPRSAHRRRRRGQGCRSRHRGSASHRRQRGRRRWERRRPSPQAGSGRSPPTGRGRRTGPAPDRSARPDPTGFRQESGCGRQARLRDPRLKPVEELLVVGVTRPVKTSFARGRSGNSRSAASTSRSTPFCARTQPKQPMTISSGAKPSRPAARCGRGWGERRPDRRRAG